MPVEITDTTEQAPTDVLEAAADLLLELLGKSDCELEVSIVGDEEMRDLNRDYRGKDGPTDVLSFSQLEGEPLAGADGVHVGDVVISLDTARRQAADGDWTLAEELNRLLVHGLLHLLGYDHETGAEDAALMHGEEARLVAGLMRAGIPCAREEVG
jgi:probable rRNA maturation factor